MKSWKIAKFQVLDTVMAVGIYYVIFVSLHILLATASIKTGGKVSSSGLEATSAFFLFVIGLNSFKTSFKFSQANQVPRKAFLKGAIMGIFPITFAMSVIDLVINRLYNIFVNSPTNFDMIYTSLRDTGMWDINWAPANDFATLFGTAVWQFAVYSIFFLSGFLISLIYYRSNKILKFIVSISPVLVAILLKIIGGFLPASFWSGIGRFVSDAFGWNSRNPYIAILSFAILGMIFSGFSYLLIRRAVVKE